MIQTFQDLSKGAFPDHFKHFKPVANVVMQHLEKQEEEHCEYVIRIYYYVLFIYLLK